MTNLQKGLLWIGGIIFVIWLLSSGGSNSSGTGEQTGYCNPNYSGCLDRAGDYDCRGGSGDGPNYTGKVRVTGRDVYGLDRDGDGWGCE